MLAKGELPDGDVDYLEMKNINHLKRNGYVLSHGYDETKPENELDINDMKDAAEFRGGAVLSESMKRAIYIRNFCGALTTDRSFTQDLTRY